MDKLLQWAIVNSQTEKEDPTGPSNPETAKKLVTPAVAVYLCGL
jgi:hypothetical protein